MSVPRLELLGALLAMRLGKLITNEHEMKITKRFLWSDSRTVLLWVKTDPREYQTFVAHRLTEILDLSDPSEWFWVPSEQNPADDASKPKIGPLHQNYRWFNGPSFLNTEKENWPSQECLKTNSYDDRLHIERKKVYSVMVIQSTITNVTEPKRFSKFNRLLRSTAWVLIAIDRLRYKIEPKMSVEHLQKAMTLLISEIQRDCFKPEIEAITRQEPINNNSRIRTLTPIIGRDGLLRVRGRVNVSDATEFEGQPIILDGGHKITRLILQNYHEKANHGSNSMVVNEIRQKFWVTNLRQSLRTTSAKCQFCILTRNKPLTPIMGDLPSSRIAYRERPFTHCGVDYFGPTMIKIGRRREKRWGVLFTCLTTRAIHIELAHSANKDSAIMALRRLIVRRGQPNAIYSDNGRNFIGANRELLSAQKELNFQAQEEFIVNLGIKWNFIPPSAPHMGGAWERLIRSVKTALKVTLRDQVPKEEVLITLLAEAEHSVNSRPLTHVSMDSRDQEALTPNHFLLGSSTGNCTLGRFETLRDCTWKQWRVAQSLSDSFWKRWLREYLPTLLPRKKWTSETEKLKIGDVVIIVDYNSPRNLWKKGIISQVFPGKDEQVRVVKVRLENTSLVPPANKLIKLHNPHKYKILDLYEGRML